MSLISDPEVRQHIDIKCAADLLICQLFEWQTGNHSCVVDQHINVTDLFPDMSGHRCNFFLIADIDNHRMCDSAISSYLFG